MEKTVKSLKALSDKTRLEIFQLLTKGELCVCEIIVAMGMTQSAVSHHLNILKEAELVEARREGKWIFYSIKANAKDTCLEVINNLFAPEGRERENRDEKLRKCATLDRKKCYSQESL